VTDQDTQLNVYQRVLAIWGEVQRLPKDQRTTGGGAFRYTSVETMAELVRELCVKHGVVVLPSTEKRNADTSMTTSNGARMEQHGVDITYTIVSVDDPEDSYTCVIAGEGRDTSDKGLGKAYTAAFKTMLRQVFWLTYGDEDPDQTGHEGRNREPAREPARAAAETAPAEEKQAVWEAACAAGLADKATAEVRKPATIAAIIKWRAGVDSIQQLPPGVSGKVVEGFAAYGRDAAKTIEHLASKGISVPEAERPPAAPPAGSQPPAQGSAPPSPAAAQTPAQSVTMPPELLAKLADQQEKLQKLRPTDKGEPLDWAVKLDQLARQWYQLTPEQGVSHVNADQARDMTTRLDATIAELERRAAAANRG
jgi:hypothetical protein